MSDEITYVDADSEDFEDAPRALREAYKKLVTAHKKVTESYTTLQGQVTNKAAADVLAGKRFKNPERVKSALLSDGIDPTDTDKVTEWLAANEGDYAKDPAQPGEEAGQEQAQEPAEPPVSAEQQAAFQSLQVDGAQAAAAADKFAKVQSLITPEMDGAQVKQLYREHGI